MTHTEWDAKMRLALDAMEARDWVSTDAHGDQLVNPAHYDSPLVTMYAHLLRVGLKNGWVTQMIPN